MTLTTEEERSKKNQSINICILFFEIERKEEEKKIRIRLRLFTLFSIVLTSRFSKVNIEFFGQYTLFSFINIQHRHTKEFYIYIFCSSN